MGDAYPMPNTPVKGGCIEFGVHSPPIMSSDLGLQSLCVGIVWWMLGRL